MTTTAEKARAAGAKTPTDKKTAVSSKVKALQAEAAEGDIVVEFEGDTYTLHGKRFNDRMADDYEFMEVITAGILPPMVNEILDGEDRDKLKELARNPETGRVSTERFAEKFNKLMEAAGLGN